MGTQKNKFKPIRSGVRYHIKSDKSIIYLEFTLDNVVYLIYEFLPIDHRIYFHRNNYKFLIDYFGGVNNLRSLASNLTADQVPEIEFKQKQYCDA